MQPNWEWAFGYLVLCVSLQLLGSVSRQPTDKDRSDALQHYNSAKNRYQDRLPCEGNNAHTHTHTRTHTHTLSHSSYVVSYTQHTHSLMRAYYVSKIIICFFSSQHESSPPSTYRDAGSRLHQCQLYWRKNHTSSHTISLCTCVTVQWGNCTVSNLYHFNQSLLVCVPFCLQGYKKRNAYIAAQAPLPNTVGDFWRMIWEFKSKCIVMLCDLAEGGVVRKHPLDKQVIAAAFPWS